MSAPVITGGRRTETLLHNFDPGGLEGYAPIGGLIRDAKHNLYGTTMERSGGGGVAFELTPPTTNGGPWTPTLLS